MRTPRRKVITNPHTGRKATVYVGSVRHRGIQRWVKGQFPTPKAWERAALELIAAIDGKLDAPTRPSVPTVAEFAGAHTDPDTGRITTDWPENHPKRRRTKASSVRRAREGIRPLCRAFGHRQPESITRAEAYRFLLDVGANTRQYAAQFFSDIMRMHPETVRDNPFRGHDLPARRPRKSRPEFCVLTDQEFDRLVQAAGKSRDDDYRLIQQGLVVAMGTACMRPGECFALRYHRHPPRPDGVQPAWIDFERDEINVTSQIDATGAEVLPKDNEERVIVLPPPMREAIRAMPQLSDFVYPAVRGGALKTGLWDAHYWPAIRAAFGDPMLEFYELKHRAITWYCTPIRDGGLGLDPPTAAHQAGHSDGGMMIVKHYLKLDEQLARQRIKDAMHAHANRRHLRAVGG